MRNSRIYNIDMVRGDTLSFGFEVDGIDNLDTAFFTCKKNGDDAEYLFQKRLGSGIYKVDDERYGVRIAPEDTQNLDPGRYYYDVEIGVNGDIFTILQGRLKVLQDTTTRGDKKPSSVTAEWGNITGDISAQIDLAAALNEKANSEELSDVATSGSYTDLLNKPSIPAKTSDLTNDSSFVVSSDLSSVATSGSYNDLLNKPSIPTKTSDLTNDSDFIVGTDLSAVATSGSYEDLSDIPYIPTKTSDLTNDSDYVVGSHLSDVATSGSYSDLSNTPNLSTVATSGSYSDLNNKPTISTVGQTGQYNDLLSKPSIPSKTSDLTNDSSFVVSSSLSSVATSGSYNDLTNKPNLSTVATSGSYADLSNKPSIPSKTSDLTNDSNFIASSSLASVATTGAYSDLTGTPNLATVATSGSYNDLSDTPNLASVATSGLITDLTGVLPLTNGGTGATNASDAKTNLGLTSQIIYESEDGTSNWNPGLTLAETAVRIGLWCRFVTKSTGKQGSWHYKEAFLNKAAAIDKNETYKISFLERYDYNLPVTLHLSDIFFTIRHYPNGWQFFTFRSESTPWVASYDFENPIAWSMDADKEIRLYKAIVFSY